MTDEPVKQLLKHLRFGGGAGVQVRASSCLPLADAIEALTAERDRLREALAFYSYEGNYKGYTAVDPCGCCSSWYEPKIHINGEDSGQIARAALKGETP